MYEWKTQGTVEEKEQKGAHVHQGSGEMVYGNYTDFINET